MKECDVNYDFPLDEGCTREDLINVHKRVLQIAVAVRDVLERNDIPYFISFGTLIGAVRHKGFVPWDRDFDIMIEEDDYEGAIECLRRELPKWLILQDQNNDERYCAFWTKVRDKYSEIETYVYEDDNEFRYKGLHIDLYKLRKSNNVVRDRLIEEQAFFTRKKKKGLISESEYEKKCQDIQRKMSQISDVPDGEERYYFLTLLDTTKNTFEEKIKLEFEGELFSAPKEYDAYLKNCYYKGDYMVPPPYDKRRCDIKKILIRDVEEKE
ncbi:MAG: LicD family protein [Agathobacter sp.]|nr:LicD family protein [Agathobacter sp.]